MGWVTEVGIKNPESDADHVFRTAVLAMVIADIKKLNTEKMIRMALLHELEESVIGDWDVHRKKKFGQEEFRRRKIEGIKEVLGKLPKDMEIKYLNLWNEIQEGKSKEARLIEEIDKLEMAFQTLEYEKEGYDKNKLKSFWEYSKERLEDSELKKIFKLLKKERS